jgi:hypothetical protein
MVLVVQDDVFDSNHGRRSLKGSRFETGIARPPNNKL